MNDPKKVVILNEILADYNLNEQEQNIDDKIKDIISTLKDDEKETIYKVLIKAKNKINKVEDEDDIKINKLKGEILIKEKQIPENIAEYIILKAEKQNQIEDLNNLIDSISLSELRNKKDKDLKNETSDLIWINNVIGVTSKSLAIGKGELLLAIMIKNAKLITTKKGVDLEVTGQEIEIKQNDAIISEEGRSSGYQNMWSSPSGIAFKKKWLSNVDLKLSTWTPIYTRFTTLPNENKLEYTKELNTLLKENDFTGDDLSTQDFSTLEKFCKKIAYMAVGNYLDGKDLILMNSDLQYVILNNKEQILEDNNIYTNASYIPRVSYKKPLPLKEEDKLTENLTNALLELFSTDHFQLRVNERGNVLDILNLKDILLKDYNPSEVKEKLKLDISSELKSRAETLLSKDIPSSNTYDVGIKVLKPVLNIDGKKYPLNLFAISTKETKDGVKEVENKGTLYFATVVDSKVTTLLLLNKEDDSDLTFQLKKHVEDQNKKPGKKPRQEREIKILTPPSYIYEIDLDELMGTKKDQGPIVIDQSTLPYKVRTDYRVGANFDHEKHGTGKIVATSAGSGGKGDARGSIDWIDVKYPKPFLKGGKLTDIRRFDNIITLASPLLAK